MLTMEDWHKIIMNFLRSIPDSEKDYQERIVSFLISIGLGWPDEDIEQQRSINIGSTQRTIPDIVLSKNGKPEVVIEVKVHHHVQQEKDRLQLLSYMKQLEINTGIYFGEKVEVYYKELGRDFPEIKLLDIGLSKDDSNWKQFVDWFRCDAFSAERLKAHYEDKMAALHDEEVVNQQLAELTSAVGHDFVTCAIADRLKKSGVRQKAIDLILSKINVKIERTDGKLDKSVSHEAVVCPMPSLHANDKRSKASYSIDGKGDYGVGRLALKIVSIVTERNTDFTFADLKQMFNSWRENIKSIAEIREWKNHTNDKSKDRRWFEDDTMISSDGVEFAVSNQWGVFNIDNIIKVGKYCGLDIKRIR